MNLKKQLHFNTHMGRMGNQMFQYACAKNLELRHGFSCSLDDMHNLKYFVLAPREKFLNKVKQKIFFHIARRLNGMSVHNLDFEDMLQDYAQWLIHINKPTMVWGFFQSEQYFRESAAEIKQYFTIKPEFQLDFRSFLAHNKLVAGEYNTMHIRRTDYKGFTVKSLTGDDFTLPLSYYRQILDQFDQSEKLVIVSDDPAFCEINFGERANVIFSKEDPITDFQILSNGRQIAISNSTYAWWAAWLSPFATKVFCPQYFLGFKEQKEVPINIYPKEWQPIAIY